MAEFPKWRDCCAVSTNVVQFISIGPSQAHEYVNKVYKGDGAISGLTNNPQALLKHAASLAHHNLLGSLERLKVC